MRKENKSPYYLIDEAFHGYGKHEESGWDTDHRGAGQFYAPSVRIRPVKSVNTKFPTFRRKNITEETSGVVTLEACLRIVSGDGFYFTPTYTESDGRIIQQWEKVEYKPEATEADYINALEDLGVKFGE